MKTAHTPGPIQVTSYGTNHISAKGFRDIDGRPNAIRVDLYTNTRTGEQFVESRHCARKGGPDYSPLYTHHGNGSCGCGWGYLNASHTQAAHEESIAEAAKQRAEYEQWRHKEQPDNTESALYAEAMSLTSNLDQ